MRFHPFSAFADFVVTRHATPDKSNDARESASVNDNDKTEEPPVENGVNKDVEMAENEDEKKTSPSPPKDEAVDIKDKSDSGDQVKESDDSKPTQDETKAASEDVDMADAAPADKPQDDKPAQDAPAEEPANEDSKDVDMTEKPFDAPEKGDAADEKAVTSNDTAPPTDETDEQPTSLSQLAIDTKDVDAPKPSTEVAMQDAPAVDVSASSKVAREREDDIADEPAPKRAKTEPKSEEPVDAGVSAPVIDSVPGEECHVSLVSSDGVMMVTRSRSLPTINAASSGRCLDA